MKLLKIRFGGFKNIKNVEIDFAQNNPISLISANNYGKSNVLTGLNFISDFLLSRPSIRERMMCDVDYIPININNARDNFSVSLTFEYNDEIDTFIADYSFSFCWATQVVTQDGTIMGISAGETIITVKSKDGNVYNVNFIEGNAQLTEAIRTDIKNYLMMEWAFEPASTDARATFEYIIKVK